MRKNKQAGAGMASGRRFAGLAAGCLIMGLLLSGCASSAGAWSPPAAGAQAATTPAATEGEKWTDAGSVTVTPVADAATGQPQAGGTTVSPTATVEAGEAVQFAGKIENLPATGDWSGNWQVAGRLVHVSTTTTIDQRQGQVAVGARVAIQGWARADSSIDAGWITVLGANATPAATPAPESTIVPGSQATPAVLATETGSEVDQDENPGAQGDENEGNAAGDERLSHPIELRGTVQQLPASGLAGTWVVSGRTLHVNAHTRLQMNLGAIAVGTFVQVKGWRQPDGSINVAWIQVKKAPPAQSNGHQNNGKGKNKDQNGKGKGNGNAGDNEGD